MAAGPAGESMGNSRPLIAWSVRTFREDVSVTHIHVWMLLDRMSKRLMLCSFFAACRTQWFA